MARQLARRRRCTGPHHPDQWCRFTCYRDSDEHAHRSSRDQPNNRAKCGGAANHCHRYRDRSSASHDHLSAQRRSRTFKHRGHDTNRHTDHRPNPDRATPDGPDGTDAQCHADERAQCDRHHQTKPYPNADHSPNRYTATVTDTNAHGAPNRNANRTTRRR